MVDLYSIKRDKICVGQVITNFEIKNPITNLLGEEIKLGHYEVSRNMLFIQDYMNCAHDLLYFSPQYPIFSEDNIKNCNNSQFIIKEVHNIGKLLEYYDYPETMNYLEVDHARLKFFDGKFPYNNCSVFGLKEIAPELQTYYDEKGKVITDYEKLKKIIKQKKRLQLLGIHNEFVPSDDFAELTREQIDQFLLPPELFNILIEHGDNSLYDVIKGYKRCLDSFKPDKSEGIIRKLKKHYY